MEVGIIMANDEEKKLQLRMFLKLLCVCVFALLYAWGGMEMKWLRRYLAPVWLTLSMFYFSRNWKVFLQAPLMFGSLSLGYGADTTWIKIIKRGIYALANGTTSLVHIWTAESVKKFWILFCLNMGIGLAISIVLGVLNPLPARAEELLFGVFFGLLVIYMPKDKTA